MQVKKKPRNAAAKKIQKASPKEKCTKKEQTEQPLLKRMIFGEERPDLTELEAGSTTILDILAPTTVDTKSKDYIVVDGVYHTYLYITGYGYATTVGSCWLAPLVEAGEGVNMSFLVKRQSKEKILSKIAQTTMVNRSRMRDVGDTRQDYEELDTPVRLLPRRRRAAVQEPLILSLLKVRKNPHLCKTRRICISRTVNSAVLEPQRAWLQKRRK